MKKILFSIFVVIIIIFGGMWFFVLGRGPKDLGMKKPTLGESAAVQTRFGTEIVLLPSGTPLDQGYKLEGKKNFDVVLTGEDLTASANNRAWKYFPLKNVQIRINPDNTLESSGIIVVAKGMSYALALGYSREQIQSAMNQYHLPQIEIPYYVKGTGGATNNIVDISISQLEIGSIPIPGSIATQVAQEAKEVVEDIIRKQSQSIQIDIAKIENGKMYGSGTIAEKEYVIGE